MKQADYMRFQKPELNRSGGFAVSWNIEETWLLTWSRKQEEPISSSSTTWVYWVII